MDIAEEAGCVHIKLDLAKRDWPDRLVLGPGRMFLFVEFKRPGEKPRRGQTALHRVLNRLGFEVHVIDSVDQFHQLLNN